MTIIDIVKTIKYEEERRKYYYSISIIIDIMWY